jgi:hypothetical protein
MLKPVKLLPIEITNLYPGGYPDSYVTIPGIGEVPFQWHVEMNVSAQYTSAPDQGMSYDGTDVKVGDSIFTTGQGRLLEIISIETQTDGFVACTIEDVDSENALTDSTQNADGSIGYGQGYLFEVRDGFPVLYPIPDALANTLPQYFAASIFGRFFNNKRYKQIEVYQAGHSFAVGDGIYLAADGSYYKSKADAPATAKLIGFVTNTDVPDKFLYQPIGPYFSDVTMPAGDPGSFVYLSGSVAGGWTTVEPTDPALRIPAWIKISDTSGIYVGGSSASVLGSQVSFDNTTAMLPGSPKSVQEALDALASGVSGYSGYSGAAGTAGSTGTSGYSGSGTSGYSGVAGSAGTSGVSGKSGYSGSGASGYSGVVGSASAFVALVSGTDYAATPFTTSSINMYLDKTAIIKPGWPLKFVQSGVTYYARVKSITSGLITIQGAPLNVGQAITSLSYGDQGGTAQVDLFISGAYGDTSSLTNAFETKMKQKFYWRLPTGYAVHFAVRHNTNAATTQPVVNLLCNSARVGSSNLTVSNTPVLNGDVAITTANYRILDTQIMEIEVVTAGNPTSGALDLTMTASLVLD